MRAVVFALAVYLGAAATDDVALLQVADQTSMLQISQDPTQMEKGDEAGHGCGCEAHDSQSACDDASTLGKCVWMGGSDGCERSIECQETEAEEVADQTSMLQISQDPTQKEKWNEDRMNMLEQRAERINAQPLQARVNDLEAELLEMKAQSEDNAGKWTWQESRDHKMRRKEMQGELQKAQGQLSKLFADMHEHWETAKIAQIPAVLPMDPKEMNKMLQVQKAKMTKMVMDGAMAAQKASHQQAAQHLSQRKHVETFKAPVTHNYLTGVGDSVDDLVERNGAPTEGWQQMHGSMQH